MENRFEKKIVASTVLIAIIPIIISFGIFLYDKLNYIELDIESNLYIAAHMLSKTPIVGEKLYNRQNDMILQDIANECIENIDIVDIVVIADMSGEKYSHKDINQIGDIFIGKDKTKVLKEGQGYYSTNKGSVGVTFRRFEPIYYNGVQVGFVMVGKQQNDIKIITSETRNLYLILFLIVFVSTVLIFKRFAKSIKKSMLNMEPEEIAKLYNEKKIIINSISDGIIALDSDNAVVEINKNCEELFDDFSIDKILHKIIPYIEKKDFFNKREMKIDKKRILVTINPIYECGKYLGSVITLIDKKEIKKIAKEITEIDEVVKDLRVNVHEFKNKLHVILGLIKIEEYEEAIKYITEIQEVRENTSEKYTYIEDQYIRAMLISRELMAREKNIDFTLGKDSNLYEKHGDIINEDFLTILGNLIENAFEACNYNNYDNRYVEVFLKEDCKTMYIEVKDNGNTIPDDIRERMFEKGVSSKVINGGLGLYLVKSKVELYDGNIDVFQDENYKKFMITLFKEDNS